MNYIELNNTKIPYKIAKKKNKNTYFYFKKEGYIQINLSKYQSEVDAVNYIRKHSDKFISKFHSSKKVEPKNKNEFYLLGSMYNVAIVPGNQIRFDSANNQVYLPTIDEKSDLIKQFYKTKMFEVITYLKEKYKDNKYVNISNVIYNTRYTSTRHGSCNAKKRRINLNLHLVKYDIKYIEYVYLHEIAHLKHQNHSIAFYNLLEQLCPNYKILRRELRKFYR